MRTAAAVQGAYYVLTGPTPFLSRRRFEAVTGPKTDWWLVNTVAGLITVAGAALWETDSRVLGAGSAAVLGAVDVYYVARRVISPVYLLDAAIQGACLALWVGSPKSKWRPMPTPPTVTARSAP